ncbi:MAG: ArsC/Spx/MgsR family protein [Bacteroidota bacterium]
MRKVYYLSTCSTSKRIIKDLDLASKNFDFQDIKVESISLKQLEKLYQLAGSYEALFSRVARKYKELGLKNLDLNESDYRNFLLEEYTFLKRPVVVIDDKIFIGSNKANLIKLAEAVG